MPREGKSALCLRPLKALSSESDLYCHSPLRRNLIYTAKDEPFHSLS